MNNNKELPFSQFGYCPLGWMFHNKGVKYCINKINERALWLVWYKDHNSTFEELLIKDNSVTIHNKNFHVLATEVYEAINDISPDITNSIFQSKNILYNLCVLCIWTAFLFFISFYYMPCYLCILYCFLFIYLISL